MERKAVYFDKMYWDALIVQNKKGQKILNAIAQEYKKLSLGEITRDQLEKILAGEYEDIKSQIRNNVDQNIKRAKLDNSAMIEVITERVFIQFFEFEEFANRQREEFINARFPAGGPYQTIPVEFENFTVIDGLVHITAENEKFLKEKYCTVWLDSEFKAEIYDELQRAREILESVKVKLLDAGVQTPLFARPNEYGFLDEVDSEVEINGALFEF